MTIAGNQEAGKQQLAPMGWPGHKTFATSCHRAAVAAVARDRAQPLAGRSGPQAEHFRNMVGLSPACGYLSLRHR